MRWDYMKEMQPEALEGICKPPKNIAKTKTFLGTLFLMSVHQQDLTEEFFKLDNSMMMKNKTKDEFWNLLIWTIICPIGVSKESKMSSSDQEQPISD